MIVSCSTIDHATTTDVIVLLAAVDIPRHALLRPFVDSAPLTELRDRPNSIYVTRRAQGNEWPFTGRWRGGHEPEPEQAVSDSVPTLQPFPTISEVTRRAPVPAHDGM